MRPDAPPHAMLPDALRAGAAMLVLLSHARDMLLCDAADQPALSWPGWLFFAVSGPGHPAVLVFFVLSGDLVTGSMLRLRAAGRWSLRTFALARLTRLWIVLVPCLLGGALLDQAGLALVAPGVAYGVPPVGHPVVAPALGPDVMLGNLLFLQTIAVPVFGSNGALWSLANEAWYYVLAALLFTAWQAPRGGRAALPFASALLVACLLPRAILALAPVWAFGAAVALLRPRLALSPAARGATIAAATVALVLTLLVERLHTMPLGAADLLLGAVVALLLLVLPQGGSGGAATLTGAMARRSYALYLSHSPVLALFAAVAVHGRRLPFGAWSVGLVAGGMALAALVAQIVWWGTERHTDRLRAWLMAGPRRSAGWRVPAGEAAR